MSQRICKEYTQGTSLEGKKNGKKGSKRPLMHLSLTRDLVVARLLIMHMRGGAGIFRIFLGLKKNCCQEPSPAQEMFMAAQNKKGR